MTGKTDRSWQHFYIWADFNNPELCPIMHLMTYLYIMEWKGGHLLPTADELKNPPLDGFCKTWLPYDLYSHRFKSMCKNILKRDGPFGFHTCRKSGYLFAIWGGATFESVMQSARHKDVVTAKKYEQDARSLLNVHEKNQQLGTITPWVPIYVKYVQMHASANERGSRHSLPVSKMTSKYLENLCHVKRSSITFGVQYVLNLALEYRPSKSSREKLKQWVDENAKPGAQVETLWTIFEDHSAKISLNTRENISSNAQTIPDSIAVNSIAVVNLIESNAVEQQATQNKKRKRVGGFDFEGIDLLKKLKG